MSQELVTPDALLTWDMGKDQGLYLALGRLPTKGSTQSEPSASPDHTPTLQEPKRTQVPTHGTLPDPTQPSHHSQSHGRRRSMSFK